MFKVPDGWRRVRLETVAEIQTGLAKGGKLAKQAVSLPYLRVANVQDGHFNLSEIKFIEVEKDKVDRYSLQKGDVLLTEGGDFDKLGRGAVWNGEIAPCLHQNHVFAVRLDQKKVLPYFFAALTASEYGRNYFLNCAKRTTNLASINKTQLSSFPVLLPPLAEQRKIAEILGAWDEAIALVERLIAALQQRKAGLAQRLLTGEVRFAAFEGEAWRSERIGSLLKVVSRPLAWDDDAEYKLLSIRRRSEGLFVREHRKGRDIMTKRMNIAHEGDFLISKMQIVHGASALVTKEFHGMHISDSYIALVARDDSKFDIRFFNWLSKTPTLYRLALVSSHGVHIEKMSFNLNDYLNHKIKFPTLRDEQGRIVDALEAAQQEISLLQKQRANLELQKQGLMQRLLTGEVRVQI